MASPTTAARSHDPQSGAAIIVALWFTVIVAGIVLTGSLSLESHRRHTRNSFVAKAQAVQIARSGLTEALSWMRRQTSQPVMVFAPQLDPSATPPILDTIDPDIGLVRELADVMRDASICGLGQAAPNPVLSALRFFSEEM